MKFYTKSSVESFMKSKSCTKKYNVVTNRDTRLTIQTTSRFKVSYKEIQEKLRITRYQIIYAKNYSLISQKKVKCDRKFLLRIFERNQLQNWLQSFLSHTRIFWRYIFTAASEMSLQKMKEKVIITTFHFMSYVRKVSKKKDFSDDSLHMQARVKLRDETKRDHETTSVLRLTLSTLKLFVCMTNLIWAN
jgi:hypothetical protein